MSLNETLNNAFHPWESMGVNDITLQGSSNQLKFKPANSGFSLSLSATNPAANSVITISDPGASASLNLGSAASSLETKTRNIASSESGKTFFISSAASASTYTLPAPNLASGATFKFIIGGVVSNAVTVASSGANMSGNAIACDATAVGGTGFTAGLFASKTNLVLSSSSAVGDQVVVSSNGTIYLASALVAVHTTITAT